MSKTRMNKVGLSIGLTFSLSFVFFFLSSMLVFEKDKTHRTAPNFLGESASYERSIATSTDYQPDVVGDSLFEEFVRANQGQIPWPPGELVKKVTTYFDRYNADYPQLEPDESILVARGRSLQAHCTDDLHPRVLRVLEIYLGKIYFGFSEKCGTAEIISWNSSTFPPQFDFLLVENYKIAASPHYDARMRMSVCNAIRVKCPSLPNLLGAN